MLTRHTDSDNTHFAEISNVPLGLKYLFYKLSLLLVRTGSQRGERCRETHMAHTLLTHSDVQYNKTSAYQPFDTIQVSVVLTGNKSINKCM